MNLAERQIEVYRVPEHPTRKRRDWAYAERKVYRSGNRIKPLEYPKVAIGVNEIIP